MNDREKATSLRLVASQRRLPPPVPRRVTAVVFDRRLYLTCGQAEKIGQKMLKTAHFQVREGSTRAAIEPRYRLQAACNGDHLVHKTESKILISAHLPSDWDFVSRVRSRG
jgi:hypothetical protein